MHRLENLLVAIELKCMLAAAFPDGAEVTANRVSALSCSLKFLFTFGSFHALNSFVFSY